MMRLSKALLERVGLALDPATPVSRLTAGQMQMVEIAKALSHEARILIMDEPTSSLTAGESEHLFRIIRQLESEQIGIIYISHRMEEVFLLSDRVTVLRDGCNAGDLSGSDATHDRVVTLMVGRELSGQYFPTREPSEAGECRSRSKTYSCRGRDTASRFRRAAERSWALPGSSERVGPS